MKIFNKLNVVSTTLLAMVFTALSPTSHYLSEAQAAATDIATVPIFTSSSTANLVKPNIMMVLDNSGSMERAYMPDDAGKFSKDEPSVGVKKYGFASGQCNGVYYNPNIIYNPPVYADGTSYPLADFNNALVDGYKSTGAKVNLSTSFKAESSDDAQPAYYYAYTGAQTTEKKKNYNPIGIDSSNNPIYTVFYNECISPIDTETKFDGTNKVKDIFTLKVVSATSGPKTVDLNGNGSLDDGDKDERQNFANWYSYYRTRILMMKTATGLAFDALDDRFRVGFMGINEDTGNFLNISDYSATQKTDWYSKLYNSVPIAQTPTRKALSQAGRLYAGKLKGTKVNGVDAENPVQYACQRNYTILSTDGFWTTNPGSNGVDSHGGLKLDGDVMGDEDSDLPRPFYDGTIVSYNETKTQPLSLTTQYTSTATHKQQKETQLQIKTKHRQQIDDDSRVTKTVTQYQKRQNDYGQTTFVREYVIESYQQTTVVRQKQLREQQTVPWLTYTPSYTRVSTQKQKQTQQFFRCDNEGNNCVQHQSDCRLTGTGSSTKPTCKFNPLSAWSNSSCTAGNGNPVTYCQTLSPQTDTTTGNGSCSAHDFDGNGLKVQCTLDPVVQQELAPGSVCVASSTTGKTCTPKTGTYNFVTVSSCTDDVTKGISCQWGTAVDLAAGTSCTTSSSQRCSDKSGSAVTTTVYSCSSNSLTGVSCSTKNTSSATSVPAGTACTSDSAIGKVCRDKAGTGVSVVMSQLACLLTANSDKGIYCGYLANTGTYVDSVKCTTSVSNGYQCRNLTPVVTTVANADCTPSATGSPVVTCVDIPPTAPFDVASCTPGVHDTYFTATCPADRETAWTNTPSCNPTVDGSGNAIFDATGNQTLCQTIDPHVATTGDGWTAQSGWFNTLSCTPKSAATNNGKTVLCSTPVVDPTIVVDTCACTAATPTDAAHPTTCTQQTTGTPPSGFTPALTPYTTYACQNNFLNKVPVATCTDEAASASNNHVKTTCSVKTDLANGVSTCTAGNAGAPTFVTTSCVRNQSGGTYDTLADTAAYYYNNNLRVPIAANGSHADSDNCKNTTTYDASIPATDLCATGMVSQYGDDTQTNQHMTTYTVGLGARGKMVATSGYKTDGNEDYSYINVDTVKTSSTCTWEDDITFNGGNCNWPHPVHDDLTAIDDLWHAAVNGHGVYFNASDPGRLKDGLSGLLSDISNASFAGTAASSAAASPKISATDNKLYSTFFKAGEWSGELISQTVNTTTGEVPVYDPKAPDPATYNWSAQAILNAKCIGSACKQQTTRKIYTAGTSANPGTHGLIDFTWTQLSNAGLDGLFKKDNIFTNPPKFPNKISALSQFCFNGSSCLTSDAQNHFTSTSDPETNGAAGENLVNYLRGDRSLEEGILPTPDKFYRRRLNILGDIVTSESQYVAGPKQTLDVALNPDYADFKATNSSRTPMIYTGANDGMLHAFDTSGNEKWAYIPSFVRPKLYTLADRNYKDKHQFFVEGTPRVADVYVGGTRNTTTGVWSGGSWKTILVGGLNAGGVGYYALDITNPTSPELLWEFTDENMGYTFGNPIITKQSDGRWVVIITSGYDNCPKTLANPNCAKNAVGDGKGHLYVLKAENGQLVDSASNIATTAGSDTDPSGLGKVVGFSPVDSFTNKVYGGDLKGNLWSFTITPDGYAKQLLATFTDKNGNPQAITTKPVVTIAGGETVVFVGTGRYLGLSDVDATTTKYSFYGVKDRGENFGNPRDASAHFIKQQATVDTCPAAPADDASTPDINESLQYVGVCSPGEAIRKVTDSTTDNIKDNTEVNGWILDFPTTTKEMSFTDPTIYAGTVLFSTSEPIAGVNQVCGAVTTSTPDSFGYKVNFLTGGAVGTQFGVVANNLGKGIATSPRLYITDHNVVKTQTNKTDSPPSYGTPPPNPPVNPTKRLSWTEGE